MQFMILSDKLVINKEKKIHLIFLQLRKRLFLLHMHTRTNRERVRERERERKHWFSLCNENKIFLQIRVYVYAAS